VTPAIIKNTMGIVNDRKRPMRASGKFTPLL